MLETWFSTPIKQEKIKFARSELIDIAHNLYNTTKSTVLWNCDTYNTLNIYDPYIAKDQCVLDLIQNSENSVTDYAKLFTTNHNFLIKTTDFWFNVAVPGAYQEFHNHPDSHFSAVVYIQTTKNSGNIIFKSYESYMNMCPLPIYQSEAANYIYELCTYEPQEFNILVFRSNLQHKVNKNLSNSNRISVSMNFRMIRN